MRSRPVLSIVLSLLALLIVGFALGEWRGWPWLAEPLERTLSDRLGRELRLLPAASGGEQAFKLRLLGGIRLQSSRLRIGGPTWRFDTPTVSAEGVELQLRYVDLWHWHRDGSLNVRSLQAREIAVDLWRDAEGRATWSFKPKESPAPAPNASAPIRFERLALDGGSIALVDKLTQVNANINFALGDRDGVYSSLFATAHGSYRGKPLSAWLDSGSPVSWIAADAESTAVPLRVQLRAGEAAFDFEGALRQPMGLQGLDGSFRLSGPSLAAIGDPIGVTLPTTAPFKARGRLVHAGAQWKADIAQALLGQSHLNGNFIYDTAQARPKLSGRLGGQSLWFADLGPTIGTTASPEAVPTRRPGGKVLPDKQFDLPALRAMDADVAIALDRIDLGGAFAEPLAPARARLLLQDGVLTVADLDARTASGRVGGVISLDGRAPTALWRADLNWAGVSLERWIKQGRAPGQPPYIAGAIDGRVQIAGRGRSTAELLGSADGRALAFLPQGQISHLAVEAAGIDVAQALGILVRGDKALPLNCAVADLRIAKGQVLPNALVVDTKDSTLWMDGSISLVDEKLDLRLQVAPKDFSPLSLRTPVHVAGTLGAPQLSLEVKPLVRKLVPAALLALLNPLAAVLPLIDTGSTDANREMLQACQRMLGTAQARIDAKPAAKAGAKR